jgi:hypothetical protein
LQPLRRDHQADRDRQSKRLLLSGMSAVTAGPRVSARPRGHAHKITCPARYASIHHPSRQTSHRRPW